jgi:large subunit ribosomal protein L4
MTTLKVYDLDRQEAGTVELHDKIADAALNPFVVKDTVVAYQSQLRQGTHKVKSRAEVAGSTRKLFRQKGTGNARAGSLRSPLRRHGGIVFGPVPRSHELSINKKVKKKALASVIAMKLKSNELLVVDQLKLPDHKTKSLVKILKNLKMEQSLIVYSEEDKNFDLASRNLQSVKYIHSSGVNVFDMLNYPNLIVTKAALQDLEGRLLR